MKKARLPSSFHQHLRTQCRLRSRNASSVLLPPLFLLIFVSVVEFSLLNVNSAPMMTPNAVWLGILLSVLMHLPHAFCTDARDGTLLYIQQTQALFTYVWATFITWWLYLLLPLLIALPFVSILLNWSFIETTAFALTLICASPSLVWLGLLGAALTLAARQNILVLIILVLPLLLPIILLSIVSQLYPSALLLLLCFSVFTATCAPFFIVICLKIINQQ